MSIADNRAPGGGFINPFKAGVPFRDLTFAKDPAGGFGSWNYSPQRTQLAQLMAGDRFANAGRRAGGFSGGYTTSGPQQGGFGYGGGMGGWGRSPGGGRSSATKGGMWGGGLY